MNGDEELAEGWAVMPLGDVIEPGGLFDGPFGSNLKTDDYTDSGVRVIRLENLANLHFVAEKETFISEAKYRTLTKHTVGRNDILVGSFVDGAVRVCVLPELKTKAIAKADCFCVRTDTRVMNRKFAALQLGRSATKDALVEEIHGATRPRITTKQLRGLAVAVPPSHEQHRIVEKVEALLAEVNKAKDRLDRVKVILKRFRQAVLAAACSGKLTEEWRKTTSCPPSRAAIDALLARQGEAKTRRGVPDAVERPESLAEFEPPDTWLCVSVAECLRSGALIDVKDGNHGANHPKVADFTPSGLPFITAAQVGRFLIDYDGAYRISGKPLKALRVGFARPGDAILTHKGSVGRSALCSRECVLTPQTTYYRAEPSVIESEFLVYWFAAPWFYAQLAAVMSQTTRDFVPISEQYNLFLVLPPLPEQREIIRLLRGLLTLADTFEARLTAATTRAERLPQSILSKAFKGELVPTEAELARAEGRSFESAEEMLTRVRGTGVEALALGNRRRRGRQRAG